jgi:hypothetical protein
MNNNERENKMIKEMQATRTEQVIFEMLTTSTGEHMLDSGGDNGRHWQRNAKKTLDDFRSEPYATLDPRYGNVSISTFHYLTSHLKYSQDMTECLEDFAKQYPDEPWREIMALFASSYGADEMQDSIEDQTWEFNTYNFDHFMIDQCLQGRFFTFGNHEYLMLQIHGGADVRGGYTAPRVFTADRYEFILDGDSATFFCEREECDNKLRVYDGGYVAELSTDTDEEDTTPENTPACPCGGAWVS